MYLKESDWVCGEPGEGGRGIPECRSSVTDCSWERREGDIAGFYSVSFLALAFLDEYSQCLKEGCPMSKRLEVPVLLHPSMKLGASWGQPQIVAPL